MTEEGKKERKKEKIERKEGCKHIMCHMFGEKQYI